MQITNISVIERRSLVPVKGWDAVVKAITIFSNGYTRGARETDRITADAIAESSGPLGLGLYLLNSLTAGDKRSNLVDRLLLEAGQSLERQTKFHKHYDYDGMGTPFMKTSVTIRKLSGDDMYGIGLNAAYVGDAPEVGLAEQLGIPRTLLSCTIEVKTEPIEDNRFEFDFEPVLRKLDPVLDINGITGQLLADAMLKIDAYESIPDVLLSVKGGLQIRIKPGCVRDRIYFDGKVKQDTWSVKGSVLSGELERDYGSDDENAKAPPTFLIEVLSPDLHGTASYIKPEPIWQPDLQDEANILAYAIAAALN